MSLYDYLKEHNEHVLFVDKCGKLLIVQCKNNIKVTFEYPSVERAQKKLTIFRRDLENQKVG